MTIPIKLVPTTGAAAELREFSATDKIGIENLPVVGAVADTGGVPSGAIMNSGKIGNGYWIQYADGTLICRLSANIGSLNFTTFYGGTTATYLWTYPLPAGIAFIDSPSISGTGRCDGHFLFLSRAAETVFTGINLYLCDTYPTAYTGANVIFSVVAIGRWKA